MKNEIVLNELAKLLEITPDDIQMDSSLMGYGNWDSLALVSMIATIDEHCHVLLKGCEIGECQVVNDIFALIESKSEILKING